ncbi:MAG: tetratricopeptide repeat protein [Bacteroidales bacterium]|jgi:serine phosphatase RsbU (regulator of sigma subunit)|nr:tetratricopeptide repeat protein [Bacteroidales bacterium]
MKRTVLFIVFSCLVINFSGQGISRLDSLKIHLSEEKSDTGKIILYYRIAHELQFSNLEESLLYAKKALDEAERMKFIKGRGNALIQLGNIEQIKGNYPEAEKYNLQALDILSGINDEAGIAICYNNLGIIAHNRNEYATALEYYKKSLEINNHIGRKSGSATSIFCIGTVYENQAKYDSALIYYFEGQAISESIGDARLMAYAKTSLANVYFMMDNYSKSLEYNEDAIKLFEKAGNDYGLLKVYISLGQTAGLIDSTDLALWFYRQALKTGYKLQTTNDIGNILFSIAGIYENMGLYDSSYVNYKKSYNLFIAVENRENSALSLISMARLLNQKNNHKDARIFLNEAIKTAVEIGSPSALTESYREMAFTWSYLNDFRQAFSYLNKYSDSKDSVMTVEKQRQILELQTQFETERKEKENALLKKDQRILQTTRNSLITGAVLLLTIVVIIFRSLSIKKRDNKLLREQKEEIARQKDIVEYQKASITDSIRYAKRIQSAMLPPDDLMKGALQDSFILYLPRDIVSGDFYWLKQISDNRALACAADCTGHGVPGAFMSMLGMSLLSDIINRNFDHIVSGIFTPADILDNMRSRVKDALRQSGKEGESRDGMDMAICIIDSGTGKLNYAGAINSVYIVDNGVLTELKGTRNPIGIYPNEISFVNNERVFPKGSMVYLFSDGYYDQIGADGGKFLSKNFRKLLSEISHLKAGEIKEKLLRTHFEWRKDEEQIDDILVMGIRI